MSSLRNYQLRWVTRKAKRESQSDELRMPHREERGGMDGSSAYEYGVGRDSRQALIQQMLVRFATSKSARIAACRITIARLHKH